MRLANHVALGIDIDPRLKFGAGAAAVVHSYDFTPPLSSEGAEAALKDNAMFGFASGSMDIRPSGPVYSLPNATLLTLTVLQFPTDDDADRAAADIEGADFGSNPRQNIHVQLGKFPTAHSHSQSGTTALESAIAHGHYVVIAFAQVPGGDPNSSSSLTEKAFDKQTAMLDSLPPLAPVDVLKLDMDTDGMLRRLLNPGKTWDPDPESLASFDLQGFLQFQADLGSEKALYNTLHIEKIGVAGSYSRTVGGYTHQGLPYGYLSGDLKNLYGDILYRSPDIKSARDVWAKILNAPDSALVPKGVPDAKCAQAPTTVDEELHLHDPLPPVCRAGLEHTTRGRSATCDGTVCTAGEQPGPVDRMCYRGARTAHAAARPAPSPVAGRNRVGRTITCSPRAAWLVG